MHCCANNMGMSNFLVLVFANHDGKMKSGQGLVNIKVLKIGTCGRTELAAKAGLLPLIKCQWKGVLLSLPKGRQMNI